MKGIEMNKNSTFQIQPSRAFLILLLIILLPVHLLSQAWDFGGSHTLLVNESSPPLKVKMKGSESLSSYRFVGKVGGVAFESIAICDLPSPTKISLSYGEGQTDGKRLLISINNHPVRHYLPDWQLIPIARYADSEYNAIVSLFGEKTDDKFYDIVYHAAFQNTLLGLRILHADMLLIDMSEFWKLPKYNGETIHGAGERLLSTSKWRKIAIELQNIINSEASQSWVLTDYNINVKFKIQSDSLIFTGRPYYYFWIADFNSYISARNNLIVKANKAYANKNNAEYNRLVHQANQLEPKVTPVSNITEKLKQKHYLIQQFNPSVYKATLRTMQYAAFFRYVKINFPGSWIVFLESIKSIKTKPEITTPTTWKKMGR